MTHPPSTLTLEEEEREFYAALGKAITQWQAIEEWLAMIFASAVGKQSADVTANAALHAVINFNTKLAMTSTAIEMLAFLSTFERPPGTESPMLMEWTTLRTRCEKRSGRRNELAHFAMERDDKRKPGYRYRLQPNIIDMRAWMKHGGKPPQRTLCSIIAQGNSFQKLGSDLMAFFLRWFPIVRASTPPAAAP